jgi:hypothetical protein
MCAAGLEQRAAGECQHHTVQRAILLWFHRHHKRWHTRTIQEHKIVDPINRVGLDCSNGLWTQKSRFAVAGGPSFSTCPTSLSN